MAQAIPAVKAITESTTVQAATNQRFGLRWYSRRVKYIWTTKAGNGSKATHSVGGQVFRGRYETSPW